MFFPDLSVALCNKTIVCTVAIAAQMFDVKHTPSKADGLTCLHWIERTDSQLTSAVLALPRLIVLRFVCVGACGSAWGRDLENSTTP